MTKERIYALVNSVSDPLTQIATTRTAEEVFYIKRFLDAMFKTHNTRRREVMALTSMQAIEAKVRKAGRQSIGDEGSPAQALDKGITGEQAERLLRSLAEEDWIDQSREEFYTLTPRALMELRSWLVEMYNEPSNDEDEWQRIKFCEACKEIVTIGQRCSELECNVRLHNICEAGYWATRRNHNCPRCDTIWDGKHYVGQKAITTTEEYLKGKRRSGVSKKRTVAVEEDEDEEEEEEEPEPSNTRRRRSRRDEDTLSDPDDE